MVNLVGCTISVKKWPKPITSIFTSLGRMLFHHRVTLTIKFTGTVLMHLGGERHLSVKSLVQEHNTMSLATTYTGTAWSEDDRTNHEATAPPSAPIKLLQKRMPEAFIHPTELVRTRILKKKKTLKGIKSILYSMWNQMFIDWNTSMAGYLRPINCLRGSKWKRCEKKNPSESLRFACTGYQTPPTK